MTDFFIPPPDTLTNASGGPLMLAFLTHLP